MSHRELQGLVHSHLDTTLDAMMTRAWNFDASIPILSNILITAGRGELKHGRLEHSPVDLAPARQHRLQGRRAPLVICDIIDSLWFP